MSDFSYSYQYKAPLVESYNPNRSKKYSNPCDNNDETIETKKEIVKNILFIVMNDVSVLARAENDFGEKFVNPFKVSKFMNVFFKGSIDNIKDLISFYKECYITNNILLEKGLYMMLLRKYTKTDLCDFLYRINNVPLRSKCRSGSKDINYMWIVDPNDSQNSTIINKIIMGQNLNMTDIKNITKSGNIYSYIGNQQQRPKK